MSTNQSNNLRSTSQQAMEVEDGTRFAFGANWSRFLSVLDDERIAEAEKSLCTMLDVEDLQGKTFLDIGSGSGLSSLAARRLGARVHSFDYDPQSVACTAELKRRYFPRDPDWRIEQGSALDADYLRSLGRFDVVYSWGVLHHTGSMWTGIELALQRVAPGGQLFLAIYNDQGLKSRAWWLVKYVYNKLPAPLNSLYAYSLGFSSLALNILKYTMKLRPMTAIRPVLGYKKRRGMSMTHDLIDWIGGFPYEFASYQGLNDHLAARRFSLIRGTAAMSLGCHEMIFERVGGDDS